MVNTTRARASMRLIPLSLSVLASLWLYGCDVLLAALPQGAADSLFAITDPRLEKSVTVDELDQVYGLAAKPDGSQIFVIGGTGVAVYDRELAHIVTYRPSTVLYINETGSERGVEDWQYSVTLNGLTRLYAPRSGREILLLPGGGMSYRELGSHIYSIIPNGAAEQDPSMPYPVDYDAAVGQVRINGTAFTGFTGPIDPPDFAVFGYNPADYGNLLVAATREKTWVGKDSVQRVVALGSITNPASGPGLGDSRDLRVPAIPDDYIPVRAQVLGTMAYICYGNTYSDLESANYSFFAYITSGPVMEPLASFSGRGIFPVPIDGGIALLSVGEKDKTVRLHRMRLVP